MRSKNCNSLHSTTDIANPGAVYVYSYVDNKWDRVEHYHPDCYKAADEPYGEPAD